MHGGEISVKSEVGKGSKFTFTLFLEQSDIKVHDPKKPLTSGIDLGDISILIVEDHPMNQLLIKATMKDQQLNYDLAINGKDAIEKLHKKNYDVILMDVHMPEMGGIKATQFIRSVFGEPKRSVPIIAMTASVSQSDLKKCLSIGMDDYIPCLLYTSPSPRD